MKLLQNDLRTFDRTQREPVNPTITAYQDRHIAMPTEASLRKMCDNIFAQFGGLLPEPVYQQALCHELRDHGACVVWEEYLLPLMYRTISGVLLTASNQYADLYAKYATGETLLVEIKTHASGIRERVEHAQIDRYATALTAQGFPPTACLIVNFNSRVAATEVDWHFEKLG